jgi:hypothetical protein
MGDYSPSVGRMREMLEQLNGKQPGDPSRAAKAIIQAVEAKSPPLRLPLGNMALDHIRAALEAEARELNAWAHMSAAADFPDANANVSR